MSKFIWRGVEDEALETELFKRIWEANVPQDASDVKNIPQDVGERIVQPNGTLLTITKTVMMSEADILRENPCFDEVGEEPKEHKKPPRRKALNAAEQHATKLLIG